jgi:hypothetical protein
MGTVWSTDFQKYLPNYEPLGFSCLVILKCLVPTLQLCTVNRVDSCDKYWMEYSIRSSNLWSCASLSLNTVLKCSIYSLESELFALIIFVVLKNASDFFYPNANYKIIISLNLFITFIIAVTLVLLHWSSGFKIINFLGAISKNHEQ